MLGTKHIVVRYVIRGQRNSLIALRPDRDRGCVPPSAARSTERCGRPDGSLEARISVYFFGQPGKTDRREDAIGRIAVIGNSVPRRCGLATFTADCCRALGQRYPEVGIDLYAMTDRPEGYAYPPEVRGEIRQDHLSDYLEAAKMITNSGASILWLQHEFGIFGGVAGGYILALLEMMTVPLVVTLHTVLAEPNDEQRVIMDRLIHRAAALVVMTDYGRALLVDVYGAFDNQIYVVPHGVPDRPFEPNESVRRREELIGRDVIMTFGLLSPNKGIEQMIEALPEIVRHFPRLIYLVVGATHPHLIALEGEAYRDKLKHQAACLGVAEHIRWINAFLDTDELLDILSIAEVYVTPYLNPAQITSGTLAYAIGLGKPVVSTPFVHAREILAHEHGRLVPFHDSEALSRQVVNLLSHPNERLALRRRAYALGRTMLWPCLAEAMMAIFLSVGTGVVDSRCNAETRLLSDCAA